MSKLKHNPIDKEKIAENPSLLPYAHSLGSALIKPIDQGKVKGQALKSMYKQTENQLSQIKEQVDLLVQQAQKIHDRIEISEVIYQAECRFKPVVGHAYHVYQKSDGGHLLSMIHPDEWSKQMPYTHIAHVELLADHTWDILD